MTDTMKRAIAFAGLAVDDQISKIGYPVGCGQGPHPETCMKIAGVAVRTFLEHFRVSNPSALLTAIIEELPKP